MLGVSQSHVSKRLELLELPTAARDAVDSGGITLEQARALHRLVGLGLDEQAASLAKQHVAGELNDYRGQSRLLEQVSTEVEEAKTRAHKAKVRSELTSAGSRVLREPKGGWWKSPVARIATGQPHRERHCLWTLAELTQISVDDHASAHPEGHAAALCTRHGEAVWMCTDPTVHAESEPQAAEHAAYSDQQAVAERARRDDERQLSRAAKAREAFAVTNLLERAVKVHASDRQLLADLVLVAAERLETEAAKLTCRLLGVEPVIERGDGEGARASKNYRHAVRQHSEVSGELGRVARALWLSQAEYRARWTYSSWTPMVLRYLDQLVDAGYILSPVEQHRYDEVQGRAMADSQSTDA
jgi:hypothetical protein